MMMMNLQAERRRQEERQDPIERTPGCQKKTFVSIFNKNLIFFIICINTKLIDIQAAVKELSRFL